MAAPSLDVDWQAVKTHAVAHGIPDAARKYEIDQAAIRQRCHREGWKDDPVIAQALDRGGALSRIVTGTAKNPAVLMGQSIKDKLLRTRANHAETALIASAEMLALAEEEPAKLRDPEVAGVLLTHGKHAALTGGWQQQAPTAKVALAVTGAHLVEQQEQTIDAEWDDAEPVTTQD